MFKVMMSLMLAIMIPMALIMICLIISKKSILDREKMSPFECGFDPSSSSRMPFSIQFFMIAILFLIFDIEIVIILPMILLLKSSIITTWFTTVALFIIILLMGLYHEWNNGVLEWTK
uniref:NADH-ubiquinone oxidoreductase chain 3 n=1 Tax=Polididus armatissimus TaxID=1524522 RepID=A0A9E9BPD2_9HEMI|nr:NADH dehydrogenase subunit 3 [Polididus armatissimus]WAJ48474.1 NADH dehydrogenase subunit 3 [Polididus armatissimus]